MKGCGRCWTEAELKLLDGDPALVPDEIVRKFGWEVTGHFEREEYEPAWRRLAYRVVQVLEDDPDDKLTQGLSWAGWSGWPEAERAALYSLFTEAVLRAAADDERWPKLGGLIQSAAQLDQSMTPWLRLVDTLPDPVVAHLAAEWSFDIFHSGGTFCFGNWLSWKDPTACEEVRGWLLTPALRDRLLEVVSADALTALEHLEWLDWEISIR